MEAKRSDAAGKPAEVTAGRPSPPPPVTSTTELKSPLDKPLCELTEEDIAQVTREDCRRFLKEKGMRRPSWNKSQAIQQVISLKALLEGRHDDDDDNGDAPSAAPSIPAFLAKRPLDPPLPVTAPQISVPPSFCPPLPRGEPAGAAKPQIEVSRGVPPPYWKRDSPGSTFSTAVPCCRPSAAGGGTPQPSTAGQPPRLTSTEGEAPVSQLTIFYDGKVNVFDGVKPEKARVIMQIAASPNCYDLPPAPSSHPSRPLQCHEPAKPAPSQARGSCFRPPPAPVPDLVLPSVPPVVYPRQIPQSSGRFPQHFRESMEETRIPREVEPDCPTSRTTSLLRYLEKRKDRFKCKKHVMGPSSSMEIFLSQRMRDPMLSGQLSCTSPMQAPGPPQTRTRCNSMENTTPNLRMSIDLNDDG